MLYYQVHRLMRVALRMVIQYCLMRLRRQPNFHDLAFVCSIWLGVTEVFQLRVGRRLWVTYNYDWSICHHQRGRIPAKLKCQGAGFSCHWFVLVKQRRFGIVSLIVVRHAPISADSHLRLYVNKRSTEVRLNFSLGAFVFWDCQCSWHS
jgi:hypothetical protein